MNRARVSIAAAGVLMLSACGGAPLYVYAPATYGSAHVESERVLDVPILGSRGSVAVANLGLTGIHSRQATQQDFVRSLHVRLVVANRSAAPWTMDLRQQIVILPGFGESRPAYASARGADPPFVEIPAGDARTIDLFYPLPEPLQRIEKTPTFDLAWSVAANEKVPGPVPRWAEAVVPHHYDPFGPFAYGQYWFNPSYGDVRFRETRPLGPGLTQPGVVVDVPAI